MLRGPQTPGELKARSERLYPFADIDAVHGALELLVQAGLVEVQERRPGQKEERYRQLLDGDVEDECTRGGCRGARRARGAPGT